MPTLQYRRLRGDMIEVYKIINGIDDHKVVTGFFELSDVEQTRGHNKKLRKLSCKINKRKNYFSNRVLMFGTTFHKKQYQQNQSKTLKLQ